MYASPGGLLTNIAYRLDQPPKQLNRIRRKMFWFSIIFLGLVAVVSAAGQFVQFLKIVNQSFINTFAHSLLESYCGLISLIIGYVLYREYRGSGKRSIFYLLMAFLSMSAFDIAHASSNDSHSLFIWFHSLSGFSGGAFFLWCASSVKHDAADSRWMQRILLASGTAALFLAVAETVHLIPILPWAVIAEIGPNMSVSLPVTWYFSKLVIVCNALSAFLFLVAGFKFYRSFKTTNDVIFFVFSLAAFLFFESEILFGFSKLWNLTWWYWHVTKLLIFVGLSIGLAHGLSRSFRDLYESRRKLSATFDELKLAYDHLKNTQQELLESEKLASIGKMAATISHEIRNPLAAIKNSAGIFKRHARLSADDEELLDIIGREINRLDTIISDFLDFAKPHPMQRTLFDLNRLIDETVALLDHTGTGRSLRISKSFDSGLPPVSGDANAIKQVLWNVFINAVQAMPHGGTLTIKTAYSKMSDDGKSGEAEIVISDTGTGMPAETAKKVFQPFFSTKSKGTGLGLSIVERTVRQHGGRVSLESTFGRGTAVSIIIPVQPAEKQASEALNNVVYLNSR